jgi:hypothetical protein
MVIKSGCKSDFIQQEALPLIESHIQQFALKGQLMSLSEKLLNPNTKKIKASV